QQDLALGRRGPDDRTLAGTDGARVGRRGQAVDDQLADLLVGLPDPLVQLLVLCRPDSPVELLEPFDLDVGHWSDLPECGTMRGMAEQETTNDVIGRRLTVVGVLGSLTVGVIWLAQWNTHQES